MKLIERKGRKERRTRISESRGARTEVRHRAADLDLTIYTVFPINTDNIFGFKIFCSWPEFLIRDDVRHLFNVICLLHCVSIALGALEVLYECARTCFAI